MVRVFMVLALTALVAGCGSRSAPRNLENACGLVAERPKYLRAMRQAERKWGVPVHVQMATIHQESKFVGNARTPRRWFLIVPLGRRSSAYGYSQALDGTWREYKDSAGRGLARRNNIRDATDFIGWYMNEARRRAGVSLTDARNQYLAYHEGIVGFRRGSHTSKPWLLRTANEVGARSERYRAQLANCRRA